MCLKCIAFGVKQDLIERVHEAAQQMAITTQMSYDEALLAILNLIRENPSPDAVAAYATYGDKDRR